MRLTSIFVVLSVVWVEQCVAVGVVGTPVGFGTGITGGGSAAPAYPSDIAQLKSWLTDNVARVIVLNKECSPLHIVLKAKKGG